LESPSHRQQIPCEFLRKVAQTLAARGLLVSERGVRGGFTPNSAPATTTKWRGNYPLGVYIRALYEQGRAEIGGHAVTVIEGEIRL